MFKLIQLTETFEKNQLDIESFHPLTDSYRFYNLLTSQEKGKLVKNEMSCLINAEDSILWGCYDNDFLTAILIFKRNNYTSSVFEIEMGDIFLYFNNSSSQLEAFKLLINSFFIWQKKSNVRHLTIRIDSSFSILIKELMRNDFYLMETLVKYLAYSTKNYGQSIPSLYKAHLFSEDPISIDDLEQLAYNSFSKDHFHMDPYLSDNSSNRIFKNWLTNAANSYMGSELLYVTKNKIPKAFFTCRPRNEICKGISKKIWGKGLGASAKDSKGAYIALVKEALFRSPAYCDIMEFETQHSNIEVLRIWERLNLQIAGSSSTLHWHA